jgi:hypothetical protein
MPGYADRFVSGLQGVLITSGSVAIVGAAVAVLTIRKHVPSTGEITAVPAD